MKSNDSPTSRRIHELDNKGLDKEVSELAGRKAKWSTDVAAIFGLMEELDVLKYPRYFQKLQSGAWTVREKYSVDPVARGETMPEALCRAILILTKGKGQYYSEQQKPCGTRSSSTSTASSRTSRRATAGSTRSLTRSSRTRRSGATKRGT